MKSDPHDPGPIGTEPQVREDLPQPWEEFARWIAEPLRPSDFPDPAMDHSAVRVIVRIAFGSFLLLTGGVTIWVGVEWMALLIDVIGMWVLSIPLILLVGAGIGRLVIR